MFHTSHILLIGLVLSVGSVIGFCLAVEINDLQQQINILSQSVAQHRNL